MNRSGFSTLLRACLLLAILAIQAGAAEPPVTLVHQGYHKDKKWIDHEFKIVMVNDSDETKWIILPRVVSRIFPDDAVFHNYADKRQPFEATRREGDGGAAVAVRFMGRDTFIAYRLGANSKLAIDGYFVTGSTLSTDLSELMVLEAHALEVNGKTSLEDWLPYPVESDKEVTILLRKGAAKDLDRDPNSGESRTDYPAEKVEYVAATKVRHWTIAFKSNGDMRKKGSNRARQK